MAGGEVCSENKAWAVASRHSFFLEDTNVVFNGHWPHAHTPARRNVLCLGRTPVIKAVAVGREKPVLQVLGLSVSCERRNVFWLQTSHPALSLVPWTVLLAQEASVFFLTAALSSLQGLHLNIILKYRIQKKRSLVERHHPTQLLRAVISRSIPVSGTCYLSGLAFSVLLKRKREKENFKTK